MTWATRFEVQDYSWGPGGTRPMPDPRSSTHWLVLQVGDVLAVELSMVPPAFAGAGQSADDGGGGRGLAGAGLAGTCRVDGQVRAAPRQGTTPVEE